MKETNYSYFSKILQKPFDTLEELRIAEDGFNKKNEAELKAKEERKSASEEVSQAYANYLQTCRDANKAIQEAKNTWIQKRQAFIDKYNSYHMTYTNIDGKEEINTSTLLDDLFNETLGNFGRLFGGFLK